MDRSGPDVVHLDPRFAFSFDPSLILRLQTILASLGQIHKFFYSHLRAKVRQFRSELKNTKKRTRSISEYLLRIRPIMDSLQAMGDSISEQDHIDTVLEGLPEEYNSFVMMIYGRNDSPSIDDIEALLLTQDSQFEKFRQELSSTSSVSVNVAQAPNLSYANPNVAANAQFATQRGGFQGAHCSRGGRGRGRGGGRGRGRGLKPTCQLW